MSNVWQKPSDKKTTIKAAESLTGALSNFPLMDTLCFGFARGRLAGAPGSNFGLGAISFLLVQFRNLI